MIPGPLRPFVIAAAVVAYASCEIGSRNLRPGVRLRTILANAAKGDATLVAGSACALAWAALATLALNRV